MRNKELWRKAKKAVAILKETGGVRLEKGQEPRELDQRDKVLSDAAFEKAMYQNHGDCCVDTEAIRADRQERIERERKMAALLAKIMPKIDFDVHRDLWADWLTLQKELGLGGEIAS